MDIIRLHEQAMDEAARLIDGVRPDQMSLPTPCSDWDVRALLAHLVGGNARYAAVAEGKPMGRGPAEGKPMGRGPVAADLLGDDPAAAYRRSAVMVTAAWRDPALLDQQFELPIGVLPGSAAIDLHLVETVAHAWDLAKATGQRLAFDPDIVRAATRFVQAGGPGERSPGAAFAAPVQVADNLPELDRLAAFLGRRP